MAVFKIFPEKTATVYSRYPLYSTGLDPIMEVDSYNVGDDGYAARTLIQFNQDEQDALIEGEIADTVVGGDNLAFTANISAYLAEGIEAPTTYTMYAYPVFQDWDRGTGKFGDIPYATDGVSWIYTKPDTYWTSPAPANTTASWNGAGVDVEGGLWYTGSNGISLEHSQTHTVNSTHDLNIDVTNSVKLHYSQSAFNYLGSIPNYGFILKLDDSIEFSSDRNTFLKYFSHNTHTIYPPSLEFKWNDTVYNTTLPNITGSIASGDNIVLKIRGNKGKYTDEGKQRFRLHVRPQFPARTFATSSAYLNNYVLPEESYYGIRDENTEEMIIDFDSTYTKISADNTSNYFDIYMNGLQPERHYRVLIKSVLDGSTSVIDEDLVFKVVRNG
jgi:hypothetical protein